MDGVNVVYSGYLKKSPPERRLMRTWHKRFFVLKSDKTLAYYPSEKDKKPVKEPIDLNFCQSIEANLHHNNKHFKHVFSIITTKRTYYLVADSHEEMDKWVKNLCKCCGFEKQDGKPSPDFVRNRANTNPKDINMPAVQSSTLPSPMTPSPPPVCPLSPPKSPSMPILSTRTDRSQSDPPDSEDIIRRAERQYIENRERRRSTEINTPSPGRPTMTLPLKMPPLSQLSECYDVVPPHNSGSLHEVDGSYESLKPPPHGIQVGQSFRQQPQANYDVVPRPRPTSEDVYDIVPNHNRYSKTSDDDTYDFPPTRNSEQGNYDVVPPPRPVSQNDQYDYVPRYNRNSYNPEETYDTLPPRYGQEGGNNYDDAHDGDVYDVVPPARPHKSGSDYYDTLPPPQKINDDDVYDIPPNMIPPARPPKSSTAAPARDHYDVIPAPGSKKSIQGLETENRDSGSYSDDIYDIPPKQSMENDICDIPPRQNDVDVYDELPRRDFDEDYYETPQSFSGPGSGAPPAVNRSIKPPPICRSSKPANHDYTNLAPPVDRKCKPVLTTRTNDNVHSYENMSAPNTARRLIKSHSLTETDPRDCQQTDYCDMQPFRAEDTRCYSFSKDQQVSSDCYEEMGPTGIKRESGVHSNSSSSEDGDTEDCYMTMGPPDKPAHPQRKAALQYCEVQIVEGQAKCQVPVPRRTAESHYTTINEESTQAFLQTCRQQETSRN